jgi:hypothetical protein
LGSPLGTGKKLLNNKKMEAKIIIKENYADDYIEKSIESADGHVFYRQVTHNSCMHRGTKTFLDSFLERLYLGYAPDELPGDTGNIVCNSGNLFYFIAKRRLQTLNFKQKFFHFLLKHIFLNGEAATVENIETLCKNYSGYYIASPAEIKRIYQSVAPKVV